MTIICGDCLEVMKTFPDNHFSAIVTDPPYGLHFMGKDWDQFKKNDYSQDPSYKIIKRTNDTNPESDRKVRGIDSGNAHSGTYDPKRNDEFQQFMFEAALGALRILKPGGHVLMFGAPRRYHRQVCALEDAGFEIRDCLMWIFGSGFPKSHNRFGLEGFGTALKPAYEPIIMAMKPLDGTFKENAEKWGQAGINIDGCRIDSEPWSRPSRPNIRGGNYCNSEEEPIPRQNTKGRWPANVIFDDEEAAKMLDEQTGNLHNAGSARNSIRKCEDKGIFGLPGDGNRYGDSGGASRFFYCPKSSSRERNEGLEELPDVECQTGCGGAMSIDDKGKVRDTFKKIAKNTHPCVKPLRLMEYLITLVAPPKNALILDPFAGSGSTILAAKQLGIEAIGIEKQAEYCEIARARLESFKEDSQMDLFKMCSEK